MEETANGHQQWDRQGWHELKRREENRSADLKRVNENLPSRMFHASRDLVSHQGPVGPSPLTAASDTQVAQVHAVAKG